MTKKEEIAKHHDVYYCSCGNHDPDLFKAMDEYAEFKMNDLSKHFDKERNKLFDLLSEARQIAIENGHLILFEKIDKALNP